MTQAENDARIELGYALAEYITKHPANYSLQQRIAILTASRVEEVPEALVRETEYWLDQMNSGDGFLEGERPAQ